MRAHQSYAFAVARNLLHDDQEALDAVQETFIRIWKNIGRFDDQTKFTTWMYAITSRICLDALRARTRRERTFVPLDSETIADGTAMDDQLDDAFERKELAAMIPTLTASLPDTQRLVFVLRDIEDLTVDEVCEVTGLSRGSVKTNLCYARRTIRERLLKSMQERTARR